MLPVFLYRRTVSPPLLSRMFVSEAKKTSRAPASIETSCRLKADESPVPSSSLQPESEKACVVTFLISMNSSPASTWPSPFQSERACGRNSLITMVDGMKVPAMAVGVRVRVGAPAGMEAELRLLGVPQMLLPPWSCPFLVMLLLLFQLLSVSAAVAETRSIVQ